MERQSEIYHDTCSVRDKADAEMSKHRNIIPQ